MFQDYYLSYIVSSYNTCPTVAIWHGYPCNNPTLEPTNKKLDESSLTVCPRAARVELVHCLQVMKGEPDTPKIPSSEDQPKALFPKRALRYFPFFCLEQISLHYSCSPHIGLHIISLDCNTLQTL